MPQDFLLNPYLNALHFASRGDKVTGIDFLTEPINLAK